MIRIAVAILVPSRIGETVIEMQRQKLFVLLVSVLPGIALAQGSGSTQCTYGDMVRRVVIMAEPGVSVPCEVHYFKDTEAPGEDQVLWSADNQAGYCEEKAAGLVASLEGWGWDCGAGAEPAAAPEPEAAAEPEAAPEPEAAAEPADEDMTEDLLPPEEPED